MEHSIFLCHSSEDKLFVRMVAKELKKRGIESWIDEAEIGPGDSIIAKIDEGISKTIFFLAFISENSIKSGWTEYELEKALTGEMKKKTLVIPAKLGECTIPSMIEHKNYADFSDLDKIDGEIDRIVKQVQTYKAMVPKHSDTPKLEKENSNNATKHEETAPMEKHNAFFILNGFRGLQEHINSLEKKMNYNFKGNKRLSVLGHLPSYIRTDDMTKEEAEILYDNWEFKSNAHSYAELINKRKDLFNDYIENKENQACDILFKSSLESYVENQFTSFDQIKDPRKEIEKRLKALLKYNRESSNYYLFFLEDKDLKKKGISKVFPKFILEPNIGIVVDLRSTEDSILYSDSIGGISTESKDILNKFYNKFNEIRKISRCNRRSNTIFLEKLIRKNEELPDESKNKQNKNK